MAAGDIIINMGVRTAGITPGLNSFERQMATSLKRIPQLAAEANAGLATMGRGGKGGMALLELSRLAEDASVGFGVNGIQGAIRGSVNNLSQFAMMVGGPIAGTIAGFAGGALSLLITGLGKTEEATKKSTNALAEYGKEIERIKNLAGDPVVAAFNIAGIGSSEAAQNQLAANRNRDDALQSQRNALERERTELRRLRGDIIALGVDGTEDEIIAGTARINELTDKVKALGQEILAIDQQRNQLGRERGQIQQRIVELTDEEKQKKAEMQGKEFDRKAREMDAREQREQAEQAERDRKKLEKDAANLLQGLLDDPGKARSASVAALQKGSSGAISAVVRAMQGGQPKQVELLTKIERNTKNQINVVSIPV